MPRDIFWRPDGKGLSLLQQEPRPEAKKDEEEEADEEEREPRMDRLMLLTPPFDLEKAQILVVGKQRFGSMSYSKNGRYAFTRLSGEDENCETGTHITAFDLDQTPPQKLFLLKKIETQNPVKLPGSIMVRMNGNGIRYALTSEGNKHIFLQSQGYQEDFKPRPFIDSIEILNDKKERVFEKDHQICSNDSSLHWTAPCSCTMVRPDNNTGTFLIQSERYIQLLTGLGKNAVLYIYPIE